MILGGLRDKNYKFRCIYVPTRLDILPVTQQLEAIELKKVNEVTFVPQVPSVPMGFGVEV